jgi:hypothetical protein
MDGPRLFDMNFALARGGILSQSPDYSDEQIESCVGSVARIWTTL